MAAATLLALTAAQWSLGQEPPTAPPNDPRLNVQNDSSQERDDAMPPTAEDLLNALRRARPSQEVIPPSGGTAFAPASESNKLLPEGAAVVDRTGRLGREGNWSVFITDPPTDEPAVKLLPNMGLEVMVRMTTSTDHVLRFVVSGEATVFRNENYLLVRVFRRAAKPKAPGVASPGEEGATKSEPRNAHKGVAGVIGPTRDADRTESTPKTQSRSDDIDKPAPPSAEDVLSALQRHEVPEPALPADALPGRAIIDRSAETERASSMVASSQYLLPEGATIVHRAGRLIRDGAWWRFVFESDHRRFPEPPMKVLPSQSLELMITARQDDSHGLVFQVSGEVSVFQGENYLLPHVAYRQITTGNVRK